jgi:hypothetical protein
LPGNDNIISNSDFEQAGTTLSLDGGVVYSWLSTFDYNTGAPPSSYVELNASQYDSGVSHSGDNSLKVASSWTLATTHPNHFIPVTSEENYFISFYHFIGIGSNNLRVRVHEFDTDKHYLSSYTTVSYVNHVGNTWHKNSFIMGSHPSAVGSLGSSTRFIAIELYSDSAATSYIDDFRVSRELTADSVVIGNLRSTDGTTYFNLDSNEIGLSDGDVRVVLNTTSGLVATYNDITQFDAGAKTGRGYFKGGHLTGRIASIPEHNYSFNLGNNTFAGIEDITITIPANYTFDAISMVFLKTDLFICGGYTDVLGLSSVPRMYKINVHTKTVTSQDITVPGASTTDYPALYSITTDGSLLYTAIIDDETEESYLFSVDPDDMSTHTHIHTLAVAASMLICDGSNI